MGLLAYITATQSLINMLIAAAISTALLGFGLRGTPPRDPAARRSRRWPSIVGGVIGILLTAVVANGDVRLVTSGAGLILILAGIVLSLVAATVLLRLGFRGRRVGDHPYCRRCGFDLFGRPPGSNLCSECGAPLEGKQAIVVGVRQRRMIPLSIGLFLLILATALSIPISRDMYRWSASYNWNRVKPESWVLAALKDPKSEADAIQELFRRFDTRKLGRDGIRQFLAHMRNRPPQDPLNNWIPYLAQQAWEDGRLDESDLRMVIAKTLDLELRVAARAEAGRVLRYSVASSGPWLHGSHAPRLEITGARYRLNDIEIPPAAITLSEIVGERLDWALPAFNDSVRLNDLALQAGPATFEARFTVSLELFAPNRPNVRVSRDLILTGSTTIVPPGTITSPPIRILPRTDLPMDAPENANATRLAVPSPLPSAALRPGKDDRWTLHVYGPDRGAIFGEVFLVSGPIERRIGTVFLQGFDTVSLPLDARPPEDSQFLFRPTPHRAAELFEAVPTYQSLFTLQLHD